MINGHFYFVKDVFYESLDDCCLMSNKGSDTPNKGGRPCHYCFLYGKYYWMIPISSQIAKFHAIYEKKVNQRGYCDTIRFGYVNGEERAFLIQNCFPVTDKYIDSEYRVSRDTVSVVVSPELSKELNGLVRKVVRLYDTGRP